MHLLKPVRILVVPRVVPSCFGNNPFFLLGESLSFVFNPFSSSETWPQQQGWVCDVGVVTASVTGLIGQIRVSLTPWSVVRTLGTGNLSHSWYCQAIGMSPWSDSNDGRVRSVEKKWNWEVMRGQTSTSSLVETLSPAVSNSILWNFQVCECINFPLHIRYFELDFCHLQMKLFCLLCTRPWNQNKPISEPKQPSRVVKTVSSATCPWILAPPLVPDPTQVPLCLLLLLWKMVKIYTVPPS